MDPDVNIGLVMAKLQKNAYEISKRNLITLATTTKANKAQIQGEIKSNLRELKMAAALSIFNPVRETDTLSALARSTNFSAVANTKFHNYPNIYIAYADLTFYIKHLEWLSWRVDLMRTYER